ncbi:MAG: peptidylprolyl isomerase [Planctomycetia bacterium]|nr:peptidylprolyl isomerase [Planctomycetia bacterium]
MKKLLEDSHLVLNSSFWDALSSARADALHSVGGRGKWKNLGILCVGVLSILWGVETSWGQVPSRPVPSRPVPGSAASPTVPTSPAATAPSATPKLDVFRKALDAYNKAMTRAGEMQRQYVALSTTEEQKEEIGEKLEKYSEYVSKLHPKLMELAEAAWLEKPSTDPDLLAYVVQALDIRMVTEEYEEANAIMRGLIQQRIPQHLPELYEVAGEICFMLNQFEQAGKFYALAEKEGVLTDRGALFQKNVTYYRIGWAKEATLRKQEAEADDLPRVLLQTTKGNIVFELYENQAPNTVANFLTLVRRKYYDGLYFDPVLAGMFAVSGYSLETEDGTPGHRIKDEFDARSARRHYRGTISMMRTGPNTASSSFFIAFAPMKEFDGQCVVFGRVIKGMEVLAKLQRMDPENPDPMAEADMIVEAKILRKREHSYRPKIIKPGEEAGDAEKEKEKPKGPSAY